MTVVLIIGCVADGGFVWPLVALLQWTGMTVVMAVG